MALKEQWMQQSQEKKVKFKLDNITPQKKEQPQKELQWVEKNFANHCFEQLREKTKEGQLPPNSVAVNLRNTVLQSKYI